MRRRYVKKKKRKREYKRRKIYGKGAFTAYANLLGKIINKTLH